MPASHGTRLTLPRPDDWHLHLRDGPMLACVLAHSVTRFARAIVMPNLKPPVTTTAAALAYRQRILDALETDTRFEPLMTLYLTDTIAPAEIRKAHATGHIKAVKLYPAGATTNAAAGVTDIAGIYPVLETLAELGLPLLIHGEVSDPAVDVFDRESVFIERVLGPLVERFTELKIVFEHITTKEAVDFVRAAPKRVAATITPQHLLYNRNALFAGGLRPHRYCLPVLKRESDREALLDAATSGEPRFFLGTDSAPHARDRKEYARGCAGIFSAHAALELYAEAFDKAERLDRLNAFAGHFGADFYGLPRNSDTIQLVKDTWKPPVAYPFEKGGIVPLRANEPVAWRLDRADATKLSN